MSEKTAHLQKGKFKVEEVPADRVPRLLTKKYILFLYQRDESSNVRANTTILCHLIVLYAQMHYPI
jgi:hypothetical protein